MMTIKTEITDLEVNTDQEEKTTKMIIEKIMGLQTILIPIKIMEIDIELKAEVLIETTEITETGMVREIIEVDPWKTPIIKEKMNPKIEDNNKTNSNIEEK